MSDEKTETPEARDERIAAAIDRYADLLMNTTDAALQGPAAAALEALIYYREDRDEQRRIQKRKARKAMPPPGAN